MRCRSIFSFLSAATLLAAAAAFQAGPDKNAEQTLPVLAGKARFWKGNLHTHSFWSDGDDFPEMIADWYKRSGYHFLALTDHNILSQGQKWVEIKDGKRDRTEALKKYRQRFGDLWVERRKEEDKELIRLKPLAEFRAVLDEPGRFLLIQGEEISHRFAKAPVHMNAVNLRDLVLPVNGTGVAETIQVNYRAVLDQRKRLGLPMLAILNHPNFGWGVRAEDMIAAEDVRFFEVFNGHPGVRNYGDAEHAGCERLWDIVLAFRLGKLRLPALYGLATDDAHNYHSFGIGKSNTGRGWIMVKTPFLSPEAIVKAMEAGDFYSSSGVELADIRSDAQQLVVEVVPVKGVEYTIEFIATMKDAPLDSKPVVDSEGKPLDVTRQYSPEIGKVVGNHKGASASYRFTGKELYVRARVVSTKQKANPFAKGDVEMAWTQPVVPASADEKERP